MSLVIIATIVLSGPGSCEPIEWPPFDSNQDQAIKLLIRSKRGAFGTNVIATMRQRDPKGTGKFLQIKVLRSQEGKQHTTVISPLSSAGIETIDDGKRTKIFFPDKPEVHDQESARHQMGDVAALLDLARKNYDFRLCRHEDIAGRPVVCIMATPHCPRLDCRHYMLDRDTAYPLRFETIRPDGTVALIHETLDVQYPSRLAVSDFVMHLPPGVPSVFYDPPRDLSEKLARSAGGFATVMPRTLPMGFSVRAIQLSKHAGTKIVVFRLSDGIVNANLYERLHVKLSFGWMPDASTASCRGIDLLLVSESLEPPLRKELLEAIMDQEIKTEPRR